MTSMKALVLKAYKQFAYEEVPAQEEFRTLLPSTVNLLGKPRLDFYAEAKAPSTALVIATGEERRFANVLLTIGVVRATR